VADLENILTSEEFDLIYSIFLADIPVSKIAFLKGVSVQAVNQRKKRILEKLKKSKYFDLD
jgi:DNA-directed RNA polymerase specialized sigma subunit